MRDRSSDSELVAIICGEISGTKWGDIWYPNSGKSVENCSVGRDGGKVDWD